MKTLFLSLLMALSVSAQDSVVGASHSYIIGSNGQVKFVDPFGDFLKIDGLHIVPKAIKHLGGQFLITDDSTVNTFPVTGDYRYFDNYDFKGKVKYVGGNYFITRSGTIHTVAANGDLYNFQDKSINLSKVKKIGGNFFFTKTDNELVTIDYNGLYYNRSVLGIDEDDVEVIGNNFFITDKDILYTVGNTVNNQTDRVEAFVYPQNEVLGKIKKKDILIKACNFLIMKDQTIITVSIYGNTKRLKFTGIPWHRVDYNKEDLLSKHFSGTNYVAFAKTNTMVVVDYKGDYTIVPRRNFYIYKTNFDQSL